MQSSNKTGLVLKVSVVLFILLATVLYKLNDYFKDEKWQNTQVQLRSRVVSIKTSVSSQLAQIKNTLSGYEGELKEADINWVQLDPFFMIAKAENTLTGIRVNQMSARSNTPAERWNAAYLEKALSLSKDKKKSAIKIQLFQDKAGAKFIILRFASGFAANKEIIVAGAAQYFQKYFDIERGGVSTTLMSTVDGLLAGHSEGEYIATKTKELTLSEKKYLVEKEEVVGTNLVLVSYVLKQKIASGFAVPMSIVGVVVGIGFVLIGILFYSLDPIEKRVERYKKQEREQIYKDTLGSLAKKNNFSLKSSLDLNNKGTAATAVPAVPSSEGAEEFNKPIVSHTEGDAPLVDAISLDKDNMQPDMVFPMENIKNEDVADADTQKMAIDKILQQNQEDSKITNQEFLSLEAEKNDLVDIERALALDDFDKDESLAQISKIELQKNLMPQKVSVSPQGGPIDKPQFQIEKKKFAVDEFVTHIRRPEKL